MRLLKLLPVRHTNSELGEGGRKQTALEQKYLCADQRKDSQTMVLNGVAVWPSDSITLTSRMFGTSKIRF